ncbi:MAG: type I-U CRISPR-associated protein Cas5/Cas6 [Bifidobacteriaceae bacterium]|jgi:hypothetical protein|nr:type I-U CRISPR-associated protein Cas5/Cas6 [Bifidobacteriaceae bacterium]
MAGPERPGIIRIDVRLIAGFFDGDISPGRHEWPPSPYRVFAALRAGAAGLRRTESPAAEQRAVDALRRLELAGPPTIHASNAVAHRRDSFVPVIPDYGGTGVNVVDVGRMDNRVKANSFPEISTSRALKPVTRVAPDVPMVAFDIETHDLTHDDVLWLDRAAAEVGYFGRSTSPAIVRVWTETPLIRGTVAHRPGPGRALNVWGPGTLAVLDAKHAAFAWGDVPFRGRPPTASVHYTMPFESWEPVGESLVTWDVLTPSRGILAARGVIRAHSQLGVLADQAPAKTQLCLIANVGTKYARGQLALALSCDSAASRNTVVGRLRELGWLPDSRGGWLQRRTWTASAQTFASAVPFRCPVGSAAKAEDRAREILGRWGEIDHLAISRQPFLRGVEPVPDRRFWFVLVRFADALAETAFPRRLGRFDGTLYPIAERQP